MTGVIHVCGTSISVPVKIIEMCKNDEMFETEMRAFIDTIVYAVKNKYQSENKNDSSTGSLFENLINSYADILKGLGETENDTDDKDNSKENK